MNLPTLKYTSLLGWLIFLILPFDELASNGTVQGDGVVQGELEVHVREFATVPARSNGDPTRLNMLTHANGKLYAVASLDGLIYDVADGQTTLWADLATALNGNLQTTDFAEGGIRSIAFHPEFSTNRKFYTSQLQVRAAAGSDITYLSDPASPVNKDSVVTEWTIDQEGTLSPPREVLRVGLPGPHVIKQITFNPYATPTDADYGNLYIAHGEGGHWTTPIGGQNNDALGKILRINPTADGSAPYSIPTDNPFIGDSTMPDEAFAFGFRNPHHISFARDGTLFSAEIGNRNAEEINIVSSGIDYGWKEREGTYVYLGPTRGDGIGELPSGDFGYTYPAAQLLHDPAYNGLIAIAGGYPIENGSELQGHYLFGEFASKGEIYYSDINELKSAVTTGSPSDLTQATIYRANVLFDHDADPSSASLAKTSMLDVLNDSPMYNPGSTRADIRFGQGPSGEVYITSKQNNTIYLITNSIDSQAPTVTMDQINSNQLEPGQITLSGTSSDTGLLTETKLLVKNNTTAEYWNGTIWTTSPFWFQPEGIEDWSHTLTLPEGNFSVVAQTSDIANNIGKGYQNISIGCEYVTTGTTNPNTSGTPLVINSATGTVISANFFNTGAIDPPYYDGLEFVSVCVEPPDSSGNVTATITTDVGLDNDFLIKAYPEFIVGTKFGNQSETSYRYYDTLDLPNEHKWPVKSDNLDQNGNPYEFANLEYVSQVKGVGLPAFTNELPDITITLDMDEYNVVSAERDVMLESFFFDTSANASIIGNNAVTNQPLAETLNNIVGIGHRHYPELRNTILEMMVHIGPLSPNDVSQAKNNPGQNQLTETYSGKDFDGDGIDDHFDVDSHAYVGSNNPSDPNPGIYSSGVDADGDGIDDEDLLPVVIGDYAYSIWYGEKRVPIIIYSRENNSTLQIDFDPATPDMDLTSEGEVNLDWNEFLDYTLNSVEVPLQQINQTEIAAGVPEEDRTVAWMDINLNPFPKMNSSSAAIGGIEFGIEPQINEPKDLPYTAVINTFEIEIDGSSFGLSDKIAPTANISNPPSTGATLVIGEAFTGSITDTGGSGVDRVSLVIWSVDNSSFVTSNGTTSHWAPVNATLLGGNPQSANWTLNTSLPVGTYVLHVYPYDVAGNFDVANRISRAFTVVDASDTIAPTATITTPATANQTIGLSPTLTGTITDNNGGSGVDHAAIVFWSPSDNSFVTLDGTPGPWAPVDATLPGGNPQSATWNLSTSLPIGTYVMHVYPYDAAGNFDVANRISKAFTVVDTSDTIAPTATITTPATANQTIGLSPTLTGTITDNNGGSGVDRAAIVFWSPSDNSFVTLDGTPGPWAPVDATLPGGNPQSANWTLNTSLPIGTYVMYVYPYDASGNFDVANRISRAFSIK